jgi:ATP-binding cassette subfamily B multidrug efflux pump
VTLLDDQAGQEDELDLAAPETRAAGRWNSAGVPTERSKDFTNALRRLWQLLGPERFVLILVAVVAITSAGLNVLGPRVLGHGTDIIVSGFIRHRGIDFARLHHVLLEAVVLYGTSAALSISSAYILAGVVQRLMYRLRSAVEDKSTREATCSAA